MGIAKLIDHEVFILIAEVVALLGLAKLLGEISKKIKQPAVLGEILAGIILGPTILGNLFPNLFQWLFIETKNSSLALDGLVQFSTLMLLFVVGLEIELKQIIKQGKGQAVFLFLKSSSPNKYLLVRFQFLYEHVFWHCTNEPIN